MKLYKIKKSDIDKKGRGLYATRDIKEGTKIINYIGKLITKKQTEESDKYDNNKPIYLFTINKKYDLDGVMLGRSAQGRPWFPAQVDAFLRGRKLAAPAYSDVLATLRDHVVALSDFYGEYTGVRVARKHVGWYLSYLVDSDQLRRDFNLLDSLQSQTTFIEGLKLAA